MREPFSQFNIVLPEFSESEKKQSEMKTLVPKKKSMFSALFKKNRAEVCSVCGKPIKAGQVYRDKNNGHCCEECYLKDHPPRKEPLIHERLRDAHIKLEIEKLLQDKLENANLEIRQCDPLDLGPCFGTGQDWEIKEAAKRYLPDNLDTPKAQLEILNCLSNVMDVYAVKKKVESAWQINTHSSRAEVEFKLARLKTALTVNQELSFQKPSFLKRRVAEASYEDLLKSWVILDYYQLLIRQVCSLYIDHHPHSSPDMGSKCYQNIMTLQCFILNKLKNGSNVLTPESGLETDDGVLRLITLKESSVYLNSNALKIWVRFHSTSSEYSFNKTILLNENELTLSLYDDGVKVRQYTLETEDNDDFSGKFFHLCVRLNHVGNPPIPVAQIDGFISDSSEDQKMGLNDIGYRMEAYFLSCGGEAREQRIKMMRGQDLVVKGLKYPGYTTPANVRLIGICPECGKSFCFHGYAFYMGQEDVAYSDDGLSCCSISAYAPIDKEKWTYEVDGITFRYYNSFNCPHCGTPYIDYKSHPEIKNFGVSGCVLLGRKYYQYQDNADSVEESGKADEQSSGKESQDRRVPADSPKDKSTLDCQRKDSLNGTDIMRGEMTAKRPPYRYYNHYYQGLSYGAFVELKRIDPLPDWEIAAAGIDLREGIPYIWNSRQKSYGFVSGSEDTWEKISFEKLSSILGSEITKENYHEWLCEEKLGSNAFERLQNYNKKINELRQPGKVEKKASECIYTGANQLDYCYIRLDQRFGSSMAYLRRTEEGYRAFAISEDTLPFELMKVPNEQTIDHWFVAQYGSREFSDRLLSAEEVSFFLNSFFSKEDDDVKSWNDIYGSARATIIWSVNGNENFSTLTNNYMKRILSLIELLSKNELVFK